MAPIRPRRSRARPFTPPPDLYTYQGRPELLNVAECLLQKPLSQELGIPIPQNNCSESYRCARALSKLNSYFKASPHTSQSA